MPRYKLPTSDKLHTEHTEVLKSKYDGAPAHTVLKGLRPGVYYQFWVSAVNQLNNEGPTSVVEGYRHERRKNIDLDVSKGTGNNAKISY